MLTLGHVPLLPLGELQLGRRDPFTPLIDLDQPCAHLGLHALELDELPAPGLDAGLGVLDQTLPTPKIFRSVPKHLLALAEVGFLCGQLRGALAELLPQRGDTRAPLLELARALAGRLLPAPLTFGERLPGSLQFPLVVGHRVQFK